jgi:hypothetical protein
MASKAVRPMGVIEAETQRSGGGSWLPTLADAKRQADLVAMSDSELREVRRACLREYAGAGKPRYRWRAECARVLLLNRGATL